MLYSMLHSMFHSMLHLTLILLVHHKFLKTLKQCFTRTFMRRFARRFSLSDSFTEVYWFFLTATDSNFSVLMPLWEKYWISFVGGAFGKPTRTTSFRYFSKDRRLVPSVFRRNSVSTREAAYWMFLLKTSTDRGVTRTIALVSWWTRRTMKS